MENEKNEEFEKQKEKTKREIERFKIYGSNELLKLDIPPTEFLIEKLLPKKGIGIVVGKPSSFKSWIVLEMAKRLSRGEDLFGKFKTQKSKVLYIDEEASVSEIKRRWMLMEEGNESDISFISMAGFQIDNLEDRNYLLKLCEEKDYKVLVLDSFRAVHSKNENDSKEAQDLINALREFIKAGITVLLIHHNRKDSYTNPNNPDQAMRGSTALLGGLDMLLSVENTKNGENSAEVVITQTKIKEGKGISAFKIIILEEDGKMKFSFDGEIEEDEQKLERTKKAILQLLKDEGQKYRQEIINILVPQYFSQATIKRAFDELKKEEKVKVIMGEKNRTYLSLTEN